MTRHRDDDEDDDTRPVDLSRGTFAMRPEGIVRSLWIICGIMVTGTVGVMSQLYGVRSDIDALNRKIDTRTADRWTLTMEREEMNRLSRDNPMWKPVDVDEIWMRVKPWEWPK